jgi:hypothetical protein
MQDARAASFKFSFNLLEGVMKLEFSEAFGMKPLRNFIPPWRAHKPF